MKVCLTQNSKASKCRSVPGLEARGEGPPPVGLGQTGKWTEDGKEAKGR